MSSTTTLLESKKRKRNVYIYMESWITIICIILSMHFIAPRKVVSSAVVTALSCSQAFENVRIRSIRSKRFFFSGMGAENREAG